MNLTNPNLEQVEDDAPSMRGRVTYVIAAAAAAATPIVAVVAGFDQLVLGRLAANHNEIAAADD